MCPMPAACDRLLRLWVRCSPMSGGGAYGPRLGPTLQREWWPSIRGSGCKQDRRTPSLSAPRQPFSATTGSMLPCASQPFPARDRMLATAFRSPATISAFADSIPGSKLPTCRFASQQTDSTARSAFLLRYRIRFAPVSAASSLLARSRVASSLDRPRSQPPLPFGSFASRRIKAFNWV
jgi:hypothetical protein